MHHRCHLLLPHTALAGLFGIRLFSLLVYPAGSPEHLLSHFSGSEVLMCLTVADHGFAAYF
jgi:hypothetical protein